MKHIKLYEEWLNEKKPAGAPEWKDSDAPDAKGRFRDLGIKDLADWLIKTRKGDIKKISGSLSQQIVFNRKRNPEYAKKMEKVRREVYKKLDRKDLLETVSIDGIIKCDNCSWEWNIANGGNDPYMCHKCGHNNDLLKTNENFIDEQELHNDEIIKMQLKNIKTYEIFVLEEGYFKGLSKSTVYKKKAQMELQSSMDDNDPEAYKQMPGDAKGKKNLKTSKHTKKYHELYSENIDYIWEVDDENALLEANDDKASTDQGPIDNKSVETGLSKKSKETGCPKGIIRAVFRRGMAAWKSGHRPGAGQEQWAYARVNSFLTGGAGTWGKADKDLAKKARAAGFNPKK